MSQEPRPSDGLLLYFGIVPAPDEARRLDEAVRRTADRLAPTLLAAPPLPPGFRTKALALR